MGVRGPHKRNTKPATTNSAGLIPEAPGQLGEAGLRAWTQLGGELARRGPITESDAYLLAVACQLADSWMIASEEVRDRPDPGSIRSQLAVAKQFQSALNELQLTRRAKSAAGLTDSKPVFPWGPNGDWGRKTAADIEREEREDAELARFLGS